MKVICRRVALLESWVDATSLQGLNAPTIQRSQVSTAYLGRLCFRFVAFGLMLAGLFALLQSATGRFLAHDLRYLGMDTIQLCGVGQGRVARFMFHDRASFGGALIAIGLLYLWLV